MTNVDIALQSVSNGVICWGEEDILFEILDDTQSRQVADKLQKMLEYELEQLGYGSYQVTITP